MLKYQIILTLLLLNLTVMKLCAQNYNRDEAANYSQEWCNDRNPEYNDYSSVGGDCANFVSQCLITGGLDMSEGTNGSGENVDAYGCIPSADNLHSHIVNYQNVRYERRNTSEGEPNWIEKGDAAILGTNSSDYWQHAIFAWSDDADETTHYAAHTGDRCDKTFSWFDDSFNSCDFYHIITTYTISGNVLDENYSGLNGVVIQFSNGAGEATTSSTGYYSHEVNTDWSGTATPSLLGHSFTPQTRSYNNLTGSQTNQFYNSMENPIADFTSNKISIKVGESVIFTDLSEYSPETLSWIFTGGSPSVSSALNPVVTYNSAGTFNVSLTAIKGEISNTELKTDYITVVIDQPDAPTNVTASDDLPNRVFVEWNAVSGASEYNVYRNTSNNPATATEICGWIPSTSYSDYSGNPNQDYYYWVKARKSTGEISDFSLFAIGSINSPSMAKFTYDQISYSPNYTVEFTNNSIGDIVSVTWNYGDGYSSNEIDEEHTYHYYSSGTYEVSLTVVNSGGVESTSTKTIVVSEDLSGDLQVSLNASQVVIEPGYQIQLFGDVYGGVPPFNYYFILGDGNTISMNDDFPSVFTDLFSYSAYGEFDVKLIVKDAYGLTGYSQTTVNVIDFDDYYDVHWLSKKDFAIMGDFIVPLGTEMKFADRSEPTRYVTGGDWYWEDQWDGCDRCSDWDYTWDWLTGKDCAFRVSSFCNNKYGITGSPHVPIVTHAYTSKGIKRIEYMPFTDEGLPHFPSIKKSVVIVDCDVNITESSFSSAVYYYYDQSNNHVYYAGTFTLSSLSGISNHENKNIELTACTNIKLKAGFKLKPVWNSSLKLKVRSSLSGGNVLDAKSKLPIPFENITVDDNLNDGSQDEFEGNYEFEGNINVYPNPTRSSFFISYNGDINDIKLIEVYNTLASLVETRLPRNNSEEFHFSDNPNGLYFIRIVFNDNSIEIRKILLNK